MIYYSADSNITSFLILMLSATEVLASKRYSMCLISLFISTNAKQVNLLIATHLYCLIFCFQRLDICQWLRSGFFHSNGWKRTLWNYILQTATRLYSLAFGKFVSPRLPGGSFCRHLKLPFYDLRQKNISVTGESTLKRRSTIERRSEVKFRPFRSTCHMHCMHDEEHCIWHFSDHFSSALTTPNPCILFSPCCSKHVS